MCWTTASFTSNCHHLRRKSRFKRQWQLTREPAVKARVKRLQSSVTYRLNEWRNEQSRDCRNPWTLEDQSSWKMTKSVMPVPTQTRQICWDFLLTCETVLY
jgi:hypothetical protein